MCQIAASSVLMSPVTDPTLLLLPPTTSRPRGEEGGKGAVERREGEEGGTEGREGAKSQAKSW